MRDRSKRYWARSSRIPITMLLVQRALITTRLIVLFRKLRLGKFWGPGLEAYSA